jgi:hypothetical protein
LINEYSPRMDLFISSSANTITSDSSYDELFKNQITTAALNKLSNSSSSSSAASSSSTSENVANANLLLGVIQDEKNQIGDSSMLRNMIVSSLVTYSYEIAYTVKRIVCIMGADL